MGLTKQQNVFVWEYLKDLNGKQAAIRAGYSEKTAEQTASRLLRNVKVKDAVQEAMKNREARTAVTQDRVLAELVKVAFTDGTDFARLTTGTRTRQEWNNKTGKLEETEIEEQYIELIDTDDLPEEKKAAISSIKPTKHGIAIESYDKIKALELIGRHLGMFKDKMEITGELPVVITGDNELED